MKTLKQIRSERIYSYFAEQMVVLIRECNNTISMLENGQIAGCYKKVIREQDYKIKCIYFCLKVCEGLREKYLSDVDEEWLKSRRAQLIEIIQFYC